MQRKGPFLGAGVTGQRNGSTVTPHSRTASYSIHTVRCLLPHVSQGRLPRCLLRSNVAALFHAVTPPCTRSGVSPCSSPVAPPTAGRLPPNWASEKMQQLENLQVKSARAVKGGWVGGKVGGEKAGRRDGLCAPHYKGRVGG
jgi:hypothetical protein